MTAEEAIGLKRMEIVVRRAHHQHPEKRGFVRRVFPRNHWCGNNDTATVYLWWVGGGAAYVGSHLLDKESK